MNPKPKSCHGLPEEIQKVYESGLTNRLCLDKIKYLRKEFPLIAPSLEAGQCTFLKSGKCELIERGINLYGCQLNKEKKVIVNIRKRWLKDFGIAVIRFYVEMTK